MSRAPLKLLSPLVLSLAALTACGGGGGGSSPLATSSGNTQAQILAITTPLSLPTAVQGLPFSITFTATGGQGALHWSIAPLSQTAPFVTGLAIDATTGVLSGTANFAGGAPFTVTVSDSASPAHTATNNFVLFANPPLSLAPANTINTHEYVSEGAVVVLIGGGIPPFKVSIDRVCLPPGMKPAPANGNVSSPIAVGAPLALGTYTCNVTVQDSFSPPELVSQVLTIKVSPPFLGIAGALPSNMLLNRPISARIFATGGTPPYTLKQQAATLPAGVSFDAATGQVSGTPTSAGPYSLFVSASDSASPALTAVQSFSGTVVQPLGRNDTPATATALPNNNLFPIPVLGSISPYIDPPNGTPAAGDQDYYAGHSLVGAIVHVQTSALDPSSPLDTVIEIVDGNGHQFSTCRQPGDTSTNFSSACVNDDLAPGIRDSALDFQVPGAAAATTNFLVHVLDWRGDARPNMIYQLVVSGAVAPLQITTPSSLGGVVGSVFGRGLAASGGTGQYAWSIASGALPPGMTLQSPVLSTSVPFSTTGTYVFGIQVHDAGPPSQSATETITFTVGTVLQVTTTSLPQGKVGTAYSAAINTTGGAAPLSFSLGGLVAWLPPGLIMNSSTGAISGTPTTAGNYSGVVVVEDVAGQQLFQSFTILVNP